jgi:hypothetical protein
VSKFFLGLLCSGLFAACSQSVTTTPSLIDGGVEIDARNAVDTPDVSVDGTPPSPDVSTSVGDVPDSSVSTECRQEMWCWERPFPTGEIATAAVVSSADRFTYITETGNLVSWDGTRWNTRQISLRGRPTGLWIGTDGEVVIGVAERISQREHWIVEVRGDAVRIVPLEGQGSITRLQASGSTLWALGARELFRRRGGSTTWERIAGPARSPVLAGMHVVAGEDVIVLESWGSGSGTGVLHRYNGTWSQLVDFRDIGGRVEGPLIEHDGDLWMRGYSTRRPFVVRVVGT